uniref:Ensconsin-like n=1 Tax=Paramormyrops kingsleyae TaxID=1676925 RepID=A0A3B3QVG0_9TELE
MLWDCPPPAAVPVFAAGARPDRQPKMAEEKRPLIASRAQAGGLRSQAAEPSGIGATRSPGSRTASRESQGTERWSKMSHDERRSATEGKRTPRPDEKQHQEVVLRRPLGHRLEHQKRWSWGAGGPTETGDRRTTSHLKQNANSGGGSKRLSSSSLERASTRVPMTSRSGDRQKAQSPSPVTGGSDGTQQKKEKEKRFSSPGAKRPASPSSVPRATSPGPGAPFIAQRRPPSPASARQGSCHRPPSPTTGRQQPPSPQPSCRAPPLQRPALTPTGPPTLRKRDAKQKDGSPVQLLPPYCQDTPGGSIAPNRTKDDSGAKPIAGSTSAEEAAKILSENRRLAREQKEKQEQLRIQREEEDRLRKEQERRLAEEERARRLEEERIRAEERKEEEEEQARLAEEQREQLETEELQRRVEVQREREEADARATEEAERQRRERERILQKNQQERMQRRKREEKGMLDENEEEDHEAKEEDLKEIRDESEVTDVGWDWPEQKPVALQELSVGVTRKADNKGTVFQQEPMAISPAPKMRQMEEGPNNGSLATQKCRVGSWSFEELIDKGVHPKTWPVIGGDVCNAEDPPEDRALNPSHSVEALSEL